MIARSQFHRLSIDINFKSLQLPQEGEKPIFNLSHLFKKMCFHFVHIKPTLREDCSIGNTCLSLFTVILWYTSTGSPWLISRCLMIFWIYNRHTYMPNLFMTCFQSYDSHTLSFAVTLLHFGPLLLQPFAASHPPGHVTVICDIFCWFSAFSSGLFQKHSWWGTDWLNHCSIHLSTYVKKSGPVT